MKNWLLFIFLSTIFNEVVSVILAPTLIDSSGEHYISPTTGTSWQSDDIICNDINGCFIECIITDTAGVCKYMNINASLTNYLSLICNGYQVCDGMDITNGPLITANITCDGTRGCNVVEFLLPTTSNVYLQSNGYESFRFATLDASNAVFVQITADNDKALYISDIYASNSNKLRLNCLVSDACRQNYVYAPYSMERVFSLYCSDSATSCNNIKVYFDSVYTNNFMDLYCPPTDSNDPCDIRYYCPISSVSYKPMTYSSTNSQYECATTGPDCCPWTNYSLISAPPTPSPTDMPTTITFDPTTAPSIAPTTMPTNAPTGYTTAPIPTMPTIAMTTDVPIVIITELLPSSVTESSENDEIETEWILKEGINCQDGYTDIDTTNSNYGLYCQPCPGNTAGSHGACTECGTLEEPNFAKTDCGYVQPWWLWLIQTLVGVGCGVGWLLKFLKQRKLKKQVQSSSETSDT